MSWLTIIVVAQILNVFALVICGGICAAIAQKKNLNVRKSFTRGALLGVIGIIILLKQKPGLQTGSGDDDARRRRLIHSRWYKGNY